MDEEKKGFVVKDKRLFDESGAARAEGAEPKEEAGGKPAAAEPDAPSEAGGGQEEYFPEVNFSSFILSLSTTALFHFGDFPDPSTNQAEKNLPAAKQLIDTLSMIERKTAGNLDENEKNLMEGVLFELRMRFIKEKT